MGSNIRSWFVWLIPFFISLGMAMGALLGSSFYFNAEVKNGLNGEIAGAAGALMVLICIVVGFTTAMVTIIVAKILHRSSPGRMALRLCLSLIGGGVTGTLGVYAQDVSTVFAWFLLVGGPALLAWFCGTGK